MKKILNLKGFLKQLSFSESSNWAVDFLKPESEVALKN